MILNIPGIKPKRISEMECKLEGYETKKRKILKIVSQPGEKEAEISHTANSLRKIKEKTPKTEENESEEDIHDFSFPINTRVFHSVNPPLDQSTYHFFSEPSPEMNQEHCNRTPVEINAPFDQSPYHFFSKQSPAMNQENCDRTPAENKSPVVVQKVSLAKSYCNMWSLPVKGVEDQSSNRDYIVGKEYLVRNDTDMDGSKHLKSDFETTDFSLISSDLSNLKSKVLENMEEKKILPVKDSKHNFPLLSSNEGVQYNFKFSAPIYTYADFAYSDSEIDASLPSSSECISCLGSSRDSCLVTSSSTDDEYEENDQHLSSFECNTLRLASSNNDSREDFFTKTVFEDSEQSELESVLSAMSVISFEDEELQGDDKRVTPKRKTRIKPFENGSLYWLGQARGMRKNDFEARETIYTRNSRDRNCNYESLRIKYPMSSNTHEKDSSGNRGKSCFGGISKAKSNHLQEQSSIQQNSKKNSQKNDFTPKIEEAQLNSKMQLDQLSTDQILAQIGFNVLAYGMPSPKSTCFEKILTMCGYKE